MSLSYRRVLLFVLTISLIALSTLTSDKSHAAFAPTAQLSRIFSRASSSYLSIDSTNPDRDDPQKTVIAGFDFGNLDRSVSACQDFNQFANGGWMAKNPIPGAFSVWGRFTQLDEQNILVLNQILEDLLKKKNLTGNEQKIADYYGSCMDEPKIEAEGIKPLEPELQRINQISDVLGLEDEIARLHAHRIPAVFGFGANQDVKDSTQIIAQVVQGGLGLPDRDE